MLRQLLQKLGYNFPIEAQVVFINPAFTLYQAPSNQPIIFPTQLTRLLNKLNTTPSALNERHKKLADHLVSLHLKVSPHSRLPKYDYNQLKKGIISSSCNSFMVASGERKLICEKCGCSERVESAVLRSIAEFKLLFPGQLPPLRSSISVGV